MSMNNKKAVASRNRQQEPQSISIGADDQKPARPAATPGKRKIQRVLSVTLAPMPVGKRND
jgi:hypothetical protein